VNPIRNIAIDHVTGLMDDNSLGMLVLGNPIDRPLAGFSWTNNILSGGGVGIVPTGGGSANCAHLGGGPVAQLDRCFKPYTFAGNVLIGVSRTWPSDNYTPATLTSVGFAGANDNIVSSYRLQALSSFRNAGTDGKNPGADVSAVEAAIAGVAP